MLDPHLRALGIDHRELSIGSMRLHQQVVRKMAEEHGASRVDGVYGLTGRQQQLLVDALYPEELGPSHAWVLSKVDKTIVEAQGVTPYLPLNQVQKSQRQEPAR